MTLLRKHELDYIQRKRDWAVVHEGLSNPVVVGYKSDQSGPAVRIALLFIDDNPSFRHKVVDPEPKVFNKQNFQNVHRYVWPNP